MVSPRQLFLPFEKRALEAAPRKGTTSVVPELAQKRRALAPDDRTLLNLYFGHQGILLHYQL
jgi:hypothetical protein